MARDRPYDVIDPRTHLCWQEGQEACRKISWMYTFLCQDRGEKTLGLDVRVKRDQFHSMRHQIKTHCNLS